MREISNNTNANTDIKRSMTEQLQRHTNTQAINRDPPELDAKSMILQKK